MVAIFAFCMETLPAFERPVCLNTTVDGGLTYFMRPNYEDPFFIVESVIDLSFYKLHLYRFEIRFYPRSLAGLIQRLAVARPILNSVFRGPLRLFLLV